MKKFYLLIIFLFPLISFSQTFNGIKSGLYKGEFDSFQSGDVQVWIEVDGDNLSFKTKEEQQPSIFSIIKTTDDYLIFRSGGYEGCYFPKDKQFYMWTEKTTSGYGQNYSLMKERLKKIYTLDQANMSLESIVYSVSLHK